MVRCVFSPHSHRRKTHIQLSARHRLRCPRRQNGHDKYTRDSGSSPFRREPFLGQVKRFPYCTNPTQLKKTCARSRYSQQSQGFIQMQVRTALQWSSEKASPKTALCMTCVIIPSARTKTVATHFTLKRRASVSSPCLSLSILHFNTSTYCKIKWATA